MTPVGAAEVVAALAAPMADRHQRWRALERFVAVWSRPLTAADGVSRDELRAAEERQGLDRSEGLYVHEAGVAYAAGELWVGPRTPETRLQLTALLPPASYW